MTRNAPQTTSTRAMTMRGMNMVMRSNTTQMNGEIRARKMVVMAAAQNSVNAAAAPVNPKIRIKLKSYWVDLIQDTVDKITDVAENTGATIAGPVPLPTRCVVVWWLWVVLCGWLRSQMPCFLGDGY